MTRPTDAVTILRGNWGAGVGYGRPSRFFAHGHQWEWTELGGGRGSLVCVDPCEPEEIHPWPDDEIVSWVARRPMRPVDRGDFDAEYIYEDVGWEDRPDLPPMSVIWASRPVWRLGQPPPTELMGFWAADVITDLARALSPLPPLGEYVWEWDV